MPLPYLFTVHGTTQPATPGASPNLDAYPLLFPSTYDQIAGVCNFSWPTPILDVSVLASTPFVPLAAAEDTPQRRWQQARNARLYAGLASWYLGSYPQIAVVDDSPLTVMARELDRQDFGARLRKRKSWVAVNAMPETHPVFPELPPATTYSDTMCRMLSEIQRHLLEPTIDGGITWSSLWSADEVLRFVNERLERFLLETGILRTRATSVVAAGTSSVDVPSDSVDLRRVAWDTGTATSGLPRVDPFGMDAGSVGWQGGTGVPYAYIEEPLPPLSIRLVSTPSANGTLDVLYVRAETVTGQCSLAIPIPAMFVPFVKYGVMADMLSKEGEASDPQRAAYCEQRFGEGVELARLLLGAKA
jgi:hypothetical protein